MATAIYLEHYLDSLETLPTELQRNFNLMRELDTRSQDVLKQIDNLADEYLEKVKSFNPEKKTEQIANINKYFSKSREYGDDKVQLAMQTYEMVDKHIRKLDADLARFEAELKEKTLGKLGRDKAKKKKKDKDKEAEDEIPKKKKRKSHLPEPDPEPSPGITVLPLSMAHPSDVLDMPVDPNEPTYCLCHQVSYGEMIGCDNQDCPIEWFHFACVNLTTKPKGKWYCPRCLNDRKRKQ